MKSRDSLVAGTITINKVPLTPALEKEAHDLIDICEVVAHSNVYTTTTSFLFFVSVYHTIQFYQPFVKKFKAVIMEFYDEDRYKDIVNFSSIDYKDKLVKSLVMEVKRNRPRSVGKMLLLDIVKWIVRVYPDTYPRFINLLTHTEKEAMNEG